MILDVSNLVINVGTHVGGLDSALGTDGKKTRSTMCAIISSWKTVSDGRPESIGLGLRAGPNMHSFLYSRCCEMIGRRQRCHGGM
jgi:hypothetical protein